MKIVFFFLPSIEHCHEQVYHVMLVMLQYESLHQLIIDFEPIYDIYFKKIKFYLKIRKNKLEYDSKQLVKFQLNFHYLYLHLQ